MIDRGEDEVQPSTEDNIENLRKQRAEAKPEVQQYVQVMSEAYYQGQYDLYNSLVEIYHAAADKTKVGEDFKKTIEGHLRSVKAYVKTTYRAMEQSGFDMSNVPVLE